MDRIRLWTQYRIACQWTTALFINCWSIWKQVMEIYRQSWSQLYWRDAHVNCMRLIVQPLCIQLFQLLFQLLQIIINGHKNIQHKLTSKINRHNAEMRFTEIFSNSECVLISREICLKSCTTSCWTERQGKQLWATLQLWWIGMWRRLKCRYVCSSMCCF